MAGVLYRSAPVAAGRNSGDEDEDEADLVLGLAFGAVAGGVRDLESIRLGDDDLLLLAPGLGVRCNAVLDALDALEDCALEDCALEDCALEDCALEDRALGDRALGRLSIWRSPRGSLRGRLRLSSSHQQWSGRRCHSLVHKGLRHSGLGHNAGIPRSNLIASSVVRAWRYCSSFMMTGRALECRKRLRSHLCSCSTAACIAAEVGLRIRGRKKILRSFGMRLLQCREFSLCQYE